MKYETKLWLYEILYLKEHKKVENMFILLTLFTQLWRLALRKVTGFGQGNHSHTMLLRINYRGKFSPSHQPVLISCL